jgi:hypothetical protein
MRMYLLAIAAAAAMLTASIPAKADDCEELKLACQHKGELGERGEGNCRRYREHCGGMRADCAELRAACLHKGELGERGEGNCRRYRETCRRH